MGYIPGEARSKQPGPHEADRARLQGWLQERGEDSHPPPPSCPQAQVLPPISCLCAPVTTLYMHSRRPPRRSLPCQHACACAEETGKPQGDAGLQVPAELRPWGGEGLRVSPGLASCPGTEPVSWRERRLQTGPGAFPTGSGIICSFGACLSMSRWPECLLAEAIL